MSTETEIIVFPVLVATVMQVLEIARRAVKSRKESCMAKETPVKMYKLSGRSCLYV